MSMVYNQIYKCRKCGEEFCPVTTRGFEEASVSMTNFIERANGATNIYRPLSPTLYVRHYCKNGNIGVADFIGYEKQEL